MKFMKIPLLCLLILILSSGFAEAQVLCGPSPSTLDTLKIGNGERAKPGDTVRIPISLTNSKDLALFNFYFEYDSTVLQPVFSYRDYLQNGVGDIIDSIDIFEVDKLGGRLIDTSKFIYFNKDKQNQLTGSNRVRMVLFTAPDFAGNSTLVSIGSGPMLYLPFVVKSTAANNTTAQFTIYEAKILDPDNPLIELGCQYSNYSDPTGDLGGDIRPRGVAGTFTVDINAVDPPVINSFTASPTTIVSGSSSTLSWDVTGADSLVINNGVGSFTSSNSFTSVSPTTNTTYTLTAYNASTTHPTATASVTVQPVGSNNPPTIAAVTGAPFTVNQGESVSFQVTASDIDASDIITLSGLSLPPNSVFNQVVGSGSVSGNFSFTPDFTQSGTFSAVFQAVDNRGGSVSRTVIINVIEIQNDRLFSTSSVGQQPVGGLRGKRNIFFPINMVTAQTVYGIQFDFKYDPVFFEVDSFIVTGRTANYVVYDNIGQTPGEIKVVTFGLNNEPIVNIVDTTAVLYAVMSIDSSAFPGDYPIYLENGWESINPDPNFPSLELVVDSGVIQVDNPGDVNLDKRIDVADLVSVVASIINTFTLSERQFDVADVITNDTVNVFDLVGIINLVFGIPLNANPAPLLDTERATINLAYSDLLKGGNEMIVVNSETPVDLAAVEIEIEYDPNAVILANPTLAADAEGMSLRYNDDKTGKMKVLVHFTNPYAGEKISSGFAEMINIPIIAKEEIIAGNKDQIKITQANFSTETAAKVEVDGIDAPNNLPASFSLSQNYPNPFNPTTTIEFSIESNKFVNLDVYNILGQHVKSLIDQSLPAGAHSVKWDATNQQGGRVSSGVYLYRLTVDNNTQSKKMLLLK